MTVLTKFDELRLKTDKQLASLISSYLDQGICRAHHALKAAGQKPSRDQCAQAECAYMKAVRLMPLLAELREDHRRSIEERLNRLQGMLEALCSVGAISIPSEPQISMLAHAMWEARGRSEGFAEEDWFRAERALKSHAA